MANTQNQKVKVTQLPLYESCCSKADSVCHKKPEAGLLEPYVHQARVEVENVVKPIVGDYPQKVAEVFKSSTQLVNESLSMVKDEKNQVARAVFITSSGFLGFILGRRGLIKRTTFGVVGALAAASYCNPEQAKDIADVGLKLAKTKFDEVSSQYDLSQYTSMLNTSSKDSGKADK